MKCVELNKKGNFDTWEPTKVDELKKKEISTSLGQKLLFEDHSMRIWEIILLPQERLPFRIINSAYCWVSLTDAIIITRCSTGVITLLSIKKGDSKFMAFNGTHSIFDFENIGENTLVMNLMEFKQTLKKSNQCIDSDS